MWLWQQRNIRKTQLLWAKLFLISFSFHLTFFGWLFFLHYDAASDIAITVQAKLSTRQAPVIFVPFKPKKEVSEPNKVSLVPKQPSSVVKQKKPKVAMQKRKENKTKAYKEKTKKLVKQKKISPVQSKSKHNAKKEIKKDVNVAKQKERERSVGNQNNQVHATYREIEAQRRQALLQKELAKCFKPPIGVPQDCVCQIKVVINWDGTIKELAVAQSSGILMYDVAARSALYTMKMPSWGKGKSLTVTFKQ